jgi:hypothetical protein
VIAFDGPLLESLFVYRYVYFVRHLCIMAFVTARKKHTDCTDGLVRLLFWS